MHMHLYYAQIQIIALWTITYQNMSTNVDQDLQRRYLNRCITPRDPRAAILAQSYQDATAVREPAISPTAREMDQSVQPHPNFSATQSEVVNANQSITKTGTKTQQAMADAAIRSFGGGDSIGKKVYDFIRAANELQTELRGIGKVHCFLSCTPENSTSQCGSRNLVPVVSDLFHSALSISNPRSSIAGMAIRDAFLIAYRVANCQFPLSHQPGYTAAEPNIQLPDWFPFSLSEMDNTPTIRSQYIICRYEFMKTMEESGMQNVVQLYGELFARIWNTGREKKLVKGRISYARMTPPWLRNRVVFVHGQNRNVSSPFAAGKLPTKSEIRESGNKDLALAIIDTFLRKEKSVYEYLTFLLEKKGITVPLDDNSSSTVHLPQTFRDEETSVAEVVSPATNHAITNNSHVSSRRTATSSIATRRTEQNLGGSSCIGTPLTSSEFFARHFPSASEAHPTPDSLLRSPVHVSESTLTQ